MILLQINLTFLKLNSYHQRKARGETQKARVLGAIFLVKGEYLSLFQHAQTEYQINLFQLKFLWLVYTIVMTAIDSQNEPSNCQHLNEQN